MADELRLTEQEKVRRGKMEDLRAKGLDQFGHKFVRTSNSGKLKEEYLECSKEELEEKNVEVSIAGRIMSKRRQGKIGFMHIQDREGKIQIFMRADSVSEEDYELFKVADIGDIIGINGIVMKTQTGELSVKATKYTHLTKALRPLPEKFHGLQDREEARRRRYVDLIVNEEAPG